MNARVQLGLLAAACLLVCRTAHAQGYSPYPSAYPPQPVMAPAGWQTGSYPPPPGPISNQVYEQLLPDDRWGFRDHDERLELVLRETLRGSWMRLDYLNGRISNQGRVLGAPLSGVPRAVSLLNSNTIRTVTPQPGDALIDVPRVNRPFLIESIDPTYDPVLNPTNPLPTGAAVVPSTDSVRWNNLNGIKGSFGIPLGQDYWIEAGFWGLEEGRGSIDVPRIPPTSILGAHGEPAIRWLATTLTTDGEPGTRIILYDLDFFSSYRVNTWSTDVNLAYNIRTEREGWNVKSLIGYRHDQYSERLNFGGSFNNNSTPDPSTTDPDDFIAPPLVLAPFGSLLDDPLTNRIDSKAFNFRNSLQLGLRNEFVHRWFTLGIEPKIALGSNHIRTRVRAQSVRNPGSADVVEVVDDTVDPPVTTTELVYLNDPDTNSTRRELRFAPTFDLGLYAEAHPTDWFTLRFGWNLVWMGRLGMADHSIRFNEVTLADGTTAPDVSAKVGLRDTVINSFTVGGTILLP